MRGPLDAPIDDRPLTAGHPGERRANRPTVIPAKAEIRPGLHASKKPKLGPIPAYAGMTEVRRVTTPIPTRAKRRAAVREILKPLQKPIDIIKFFLRPEAVAGALAQLFKNFTRPLRVDRIRHLD